MPFQVLIVDSDEKQLEEFRNHIAGPEYQVDGAADLTTARDKLSSQNYNAVVCEINLNDGQEFELLESAGELDKQTNFIMTAPDQQLDTVLMSLKLGAYNYLKKPISEADLVRAVKEACSDNETKEEIDIQLGEAGWVELLMPSSENTMHRLDRFFRLMYEGNLPPEILEDIGLCFREVVKNSIEWGHQNDIKKRVIISHMLFQDEFVFKIEDNGNGYDISKILEGPGDDLVAMEEERLNKGIRPGGLGMTMVKSLMDNVVYNARGNMIILSKSILPQEESIIQE